MLWQCPDILRRSSHNRAGFGDRNLSSKVFQSFWTGETFQKKGQTILCCNPTALDVMSSHASNCVRPAVQTTHTCRFLQPCRGLTSRQIRLSTPSPAYSTHRQTRQCIARAENDNKSQTDLQVKPSPFLAEALVSETPTPYQGEEMFIVHRMSLSGHEESDCRSLEDSHSASI